MWALSSSLEYSHSIPLYWIGLTKNKDTPLLTLQAFLKGGDIFQELAGHWLGGSGPVEREKTKRIVYSVMYGAGAQKLAEYLQVSFSEASNIIASFVGQY